MNEESPAFAADELWTRFLADDALDPAERAALHAAIAQDDLLHRRLLHDLRVHGALVAAGQSEADGEVTVAAIRARLEAGSRRGGGMARTAPGKASGRRRLVRGLLAGSAVVAVAVAVAVLWPRPTPLRPGTAVQRNDPGFEKVAGRAASGGRAGASMPARPRGAMASLRVARTALLLVGSDETNHPSLDGSLQPGDERLRRRLERLGFSTAVSRVNGATFDEAGRVSLIVLSSTVSVRRLGAALTELPVPVVTLEPAAFNRLGLTGARWMDDMGATPSGQDEIVVHAQRHALAAGLSGAVRVLVHPEVMSWGVPGPGAAVIAGCGGAAPGAAAIFGYEAGAAMGQGWAPARRVGLFLNDGRAVRALNDEGWRLFDAAALWAAGELP